MDDIGTKLHRLIELTRLFEQIEMEKIRYPLRKVRPGKLPEPTDDLPIFDELYNHAGQGVEIVASGSTAAGLKRQTENEEVRGKILDTLEQLGQLTVGEDDLVFDGTRFVLPAAMKGDVSKAVDYLNNWIRQQSEEFDFLRKFNYRPWDGAAAFDRAMKKVFGTSGVGVAQESLFGTKRPQYHTINVSPNETMQIPWGSVEFSPLEAEFNLNATMDADYGMVFGVSVKAPRKYRAHIEAFLQVVEDELRSHSIYRGKAFAGGDNPSFLDTSATDPTKVIYSEEVNIQLDTNMWSLLEYTDNMRANGVPLKRAVLIEGPYGTGKTLAGMLTAKKAVENGWTFVMARPGKDDLASVLQIAQLYAPAVVWYEDIDLVARGESDEQISELLDALDGITNKGVAILAGFTTNHVKNIQKGVLRPGRLDAVIHVDGLDRAGFEKLVRATVDETSLGSVDYDVVAEAFDGFLPAFAKEAIDRAKRYSIARNRGSLGVLETVDFVNAAHGLRPQLALMQEATEGVKIEPLDVVFQRVVKQAIDRADLVDDDGDPHFTVRSNGIK